MWMHSLTTTDVISQTLDRSGGIIEQCVSSHERRGKEMSHCGDERGLSGPRNINLF